MNSGRIFSVIVAIFLLGLGMVDSAETAPLAQQSNCTIPSSGPWPPCATSGAATNTNSCVIPPSGPWPACAKGSAAGGGNANACVIPTSGPWPACATSGSPTGNSSGGSCNIPASGPWPPCATGTTTEFPTPTSSKLCPNPSGQGPWILCSDAAGPPKINSFWGRVTPLGDGSDHVELHWDTQGGSFVQIIVGVNFTWSDFRRDVEPSGSVSITYDSDYYSKGNIGVIVCNSSGMNCAERLVPVTFSCEHSFFFPTNGPRSGACPETAPREVQMVYQPFENGFMMWIDGHHSGNSSFSYVYKFRESGSYYWDQDTWTSAEPINDPTLTPPAGKYQPTHGLGKQWRANDFWLRDRFGWATQPEQVYVGKIQQVADAPMGGNTYYISLPNTNQIIELCAPKRGNHCSSYEIITP